MLETDCIVSQYVIHVLDPSAIPSNPEHEGSNSLGPNAYGPDVERAGINQHSALSDASTEEVGALSAAAMYAPRIASLLHQIIESFEPSFDNFHRSDTDIRPGTSAGLLDPPQTSFASTSGGSDLMSNPGETLPPVLNYDSDALYRVPSKTTIFSSHIPVKSVSNPLLKHAACAYAAKHLLRVNGVKNIVSRINLSRATMEQCESADQEDWAINAM
ncbi:MAG: hypothetical protein Q9186_006317 [Xanthomendoza sp. 1 TL-2023]